MAPRQLLNTAIGNCDSLSAGSSETTVKHKLLQTTTVLCLNLAAWKLNKALLKHQLVRPTIALCITLATSELQRKYTNFSREYFRPSGYKETLVVWHSMVLGSIYDTACKTTKASDGCGKDLCTGAVVHIRRSMAVGYRCHKPRRHPYTVSGQAARAPCCKGNTADADIPGTASFW
jgi:hypothetical protein